MGGAVIAKQYTEEDAKWGDEAEVRVWEWLSGMYEKCVRHPFGRYGTDILVGNADGHVLVEVERRRPESWSTGKFPQGYATYHIPERRITKKTYAKREVRFATVVVATSADMEHLLLAPMSCVEDRPYNLHADKYNRGGERKKDVMRGEFVEVEGRPQKTLHDMLKRWLVPLPWAPAGHSITLSRSSPQNNARSKQMELNY